MKTWFKLKELKSVVAYIHRYYKSNNSLVYLTCTKYTILLHVILIEV